MNANCIFAAKDIAQSGSIDPTCQDSGITPVMTSGYPLSNLLLPNLWQGARFATNDLANTQFVVDLGSIQPISMIALLKHNIEVGGLWQVNIYDTLSNYQGASPVYASPSTSIIPVYSTFGTLPWGTFEWGEATSESNLVGYNRHAYMPLNTVVLGRFISVTLLSDTNTQPITAYRFWAGQYYQPTFNADYGSELEPVDETPFKKGFSGARTYGQTVKRRQMKLNFSSLPQAELLNNIYGPLFLRNGSKEPLIFMLFPQDSTQWMTTSVYGNIQPQSPNSLPFSTWLQMAATITIEENV